MFVNYRPLASRMSGQSLASASAQSRYLHGIDFKNPFTMSKRVVSTQHHRDLHRGEPFLFIPRLCLWPRVAAEHGLSD
ncbi:hypothetical protein SPHINGO361_70180 [Sphingomonas sp. EC-HK361]|nr:hypothetical protein SPHINGO361_70180 [Sphingomonas sp. EC-HK361]